MVYTNGLTPWKSNFAFCPFTTFYPDGLFSTKVGKCLTEDDPPLYKMDSAE